MLDEVIVFLDESFLRKVRIIARDNASWKISISIFWVTMHG